MINSTLEECKALNGGGLCANNGVTFDNISSVEFRACSATGEKHRRRDNVATRV